MFAAALLATHYYRTVLEKVLSFLLTHSLTYFSLVYLYSLKCECVLRLHFTSIIFASVRQISC